MSSTSPALFFSYPRADRRRCAHLLRELRARTQVWRDEDRVAEFSSITDAVERGLAQCRLFVAFYSERYAESHACQTELFAAWQAAVRLGDPAERIVVVNPDEGVSHIQPVELRDARFIAHRPAARAAATIVERLGQLRGSLTAEVVSAPPAWFGWTPVGSRRFVGRHRESWSIHSGLRSGEHRMVVRSRVPLVQLVGVGGVGKSMLAEQYGLRFGAAWPGGVVWLRAGEPLDDGLRRILRAFDAETDGATQALRGRLSRLFETRGRYLWVVDDVPDGLDRDELA
ncbi:MAG: toll/interleukin-1 receptor domain-containing protein, partial [Myxococcota bacterium]